MPGMNWKRISVLACAAALAPVTALLAQENAGIVRITDRAVKNVAHQTPGQFQAMSAAAVGGGNGYVDGAYAGDCPECYGGKHGKAGKSGTFKEHYCSHSPDHGFSVPGKWPIHRRGVQYMHYYPQTWAGMEGPAVGEVPQYPMVYMPTDTTQLGFYYQHVPFWQPQPNPMPRRPIPAQWHHYAPTVNAADVGYGYGYGGRYGADCPVITTGSPTPMVAEPAAQPAPVNAQPAPLPTAPQQPMPLPPPPPEV